MTPKQLKLNKVGEVYTPAYPIEMLELFSGRNFEMDKINNYIPQKGYHLIIYGDRGVGKTSLSNIIKVIFEDQDRQVVKISCNSDDTFESLWYNVLSQISIEYEEIKQKIGFGDNIEKSDKTITLSSLCKGDQINVHVLLELFALLKSPIIILDEFDRLESTKFNRKLFTDFLKAISDSLPNVTIIVVGVSEDVGALIQEHESIERNLGQIYMPSMSSEEIETIIRKGEDSIPIKFEEQEIQKIIDLSSGYPHFTHALCYHSAFAAIWDDSDVVTNDHLISAIKQTVDNAHESLKNSYRIATLATKKNIFKNVLYAASIVNTDEYGYFQANDLEPILTQVLGKDMKVNKFTSHIRKFCTPERGNIFRMTGAKNRHRYKFKNPLMKAFIRLKIESQKTI